eukprot:scaffold1102_cov256-Pinguiococcus_pyrenoidosus.AAC.2
MKLREEKLGEPSVRSILKSCGSATASCGASAPGDAILPSATAPSDSGELSMAKISSPELLLVLRRFRMYSPAARLRYSRMAPSVRGPRGPKRDARVTTFLGDTRGKRSKFERARWAGAA